MSADARRPGGWRRYFSPQRMLAIARKEIRQLARDRLTLGMIVGIPTVQLLLFGYAINTDVRHLKALVYDAARTSSSRQLIQRIGQSQLFDYVGEAGSADEIEKAFRSGRANAGIVIPEDFSRRLRRGDRPLAQLMIDGTDPQISAAARGIVSIPFQERGPQPDPAIPGPKVFEVRTYYNPERITSTSIVPGLMAIILTMTMVLFTSLAIVRERERGNLELLITTPVSSLELMLGKILPYIVIGYIQLTIVLIVGKVVFAVPIRGFLGTLYLLALGFIAANLSVGLVFSTIAKSQLQSMQLVMFFFLPSILLSGYMFPFEGMPVAARCLGEILPATHFIRVVRGILVRGASGFEVAHEMVPLAIFFLVTMSVAAKRFRKTLD